MHFVIFFSIYNRSSGVILLSQIRIYNTEAEERQRDRIILSLYICTCQNKPITNTRNLATLGNKSQFQLFRISIFLRDLFQFFFITPDFLQYYYYYYYYYVTKSL